MVKGECERPIGRNFDGRKEGMLSHIRAADQIVNGATEIVCKVDHVFRIRNFALAPFGYGRIPDFAFLCQRVFRAAFLLHQLFETNEERNGII